MGCRIGTFILLQALTLKDTCLHRVTLLDVKLLEVSKGYLLPAFSAGFLRFGK